MTIRARAVVACTALVTVLGLLAGVLVVSAQQSPPAGNQPAHSTPADAVPALPHAVLLGPGQIQTLDAPDVTRVAIGEPNIADVAIISPSQILIKAKSTGTTNIIIWDTRGQKQTTVTVVDPSAGAIMQELVSVIQQLGLPNVKVELKGGKIFMLGEVETEADVGVLEQMATSFRDQVVNLVKIKEPPAPSLDPPPLVKLSVQVLEINRTELDKLGVKWTEGFTITQPEVDEPTFTGTESLTRFGTGLTRTGLSATFNALVRDNKARVLSEPSLVTASGKEAKSFIGVEVPVIQATSVGSTAESVNASIQFRQTGVMLKITPTVQEGGRDRKITTMLEAEVSDIDTSVGLNVPVGSQTIVVPGFKSRSVSTEVTTLSGESIVIAGLLEFKESHNVDQVPGLGSMPILGRLFRSPEVSGTQNELVITVTPELVGDRAVDAERGMVLDQALAVAEVTASVDDPRLRYALQIQQRIARQLRFPQREKELGLGGTVKLRLHLFRDGTLGRAIVSESSGIQAFDAEALKAAETQSPYPPFPSQLPEEELWLEVPVIFRP